jgi:hypothetical protein
MKRIALLALIVTAGCFVGMTPVDVQTLLSRTLALEHENGRLAAENCELRSRVGMTTPGSQPATLVITLPPETDGGLPPPRDGGRPADH